MIKKLSSLLFEDEEEEIEDDMDDEIEEVVRPIPPVVEKKPEPVYVAPVEEKKPEPVFVEPVVEKEPEPVLFDVPEEDEEEEPVPAPKPSMMRIDVTQQIPVVQPKPTLGITADAEKKPQKPQTRTPKPLKQSRPATPAVEEKESPVYQFRPVISPIFGVDEKDVNSLKNTTNKIKNVKNQKNAGNVSPVLSPIYGIYNEEVEEVVEEVIAPVNLMNDIETRKAPVTEDVSEFSLDDILKVRDEEFAAEKPVLDTGFMPDFPEFDFDDEDDTAELLADTLEVLPVTSSINDDDYDDDMDIDSTIVIRQSLFED